MSDQLNEFNNESGCPKCGSGLISPVKYTWWGGVLGPKLLHHTKCNACNFKYNANGIIIYSVVLAAIAFILFFYIFKPGRF
jgi:predicted Zn-ribbon and HTH transcriptional regulator